MKKKVYVRLTDINNLWGPAKTIISETLTTYIRCTSNMGTSTEQDLVSMLVHRDEMSRSDLDRQGRPCPTQIEM